MCNVVLVRSNSVNPDPPVEKVANSLLGLDYKVTILGWDRNHDYECNLEEVQMKNGACIVVRFGIKASFGAGLKGNLIPLFRFQYKIYKWLTENISNYEIIHAFDFDTGYISSKIVKKYHKKLVYHILDYYIDAHSINNKLLNNAIHRNEDCVIAIADATIICTEERREQIKTSRPKRLYIIHNTPDCEAVISKEKLLKSNQDHKLRVVYVGILAPSRMLLELCDVISNNSKYELHIAGFGGLESAINEYAHSSDNIFFYGKLPYNKTLALESQCDVMIAMYDPSVKNNRFSAPNKFYEALMLGKPIIMSQGTGHDKIICDNDIGEVAPFSKIGLMNALNNLYKKKDTYEKVKNTANCLYKNHYSWKIMNDRLAEIYKSIT